MVSNAFHGPTCHESGLVPFSTCTISLTIIIGSGCTTALHMRVVWYPSLYNDTYRYHRFRLPNCSTHKSGWFPSLHNDTLRMFSYPWFEIFFSVAPCSSNHCKINQKHSIKYNDNRFCSEKKHYCCKHKYLLYVHRYNNLGG